MKTKYSKSFTFPPQTLPLLSTAMTRWSCTPMAFALEKTMANSSWARSTSSQRRPKWLPSTASTSEGRLESLDRSVTDWSLTKHGAVRTRGCLTGIPPTSMTAVGLVPRLSRGMWKSRDPGLPRKRNGFGRRETPIWTSTVEVNLVSVNQYLMKHIPTNKGILQTQDMSYKVKQDAIIQLLIFRLYCRIIVKPD